MEIKNKKGIIRVKTMDEIVCSKKCEHFSCHQVMAHCFKYFEFQEDVPGSNNFVRCDQCLKDFGMGVK